MLGMSEGAFAGLLNVQIAAIAERGNQEKSFWIEEMKKIERYSREEAICELIKTKKIHEKIAQIDAYIRGLQI